MKLIFSFFWQHIKPYKWLYLVMLTAPVFSSFFPFMYNYAIKMFLDSIASQAALGLTLTYKSVLWPIALFLGAHIVQDIVWRVSNIAEWHSIPHVRQSMIVKTYDYVQHYS
jgi:ATP-binding cassette subfamily B protein